jgi:hypothetical protein
MPGVFTQAPLADGQLPATVAALFTATALTLVKTIVVTNTAAVAKTINIYVNRGTRRRIFPVDMSLAAGASATFDSPFSLSIGNSIDGDASSATTIDYFISGVLET